LRQASESLAGRIETISLSGLGLDELGSEALGRHWRRGGFPPSYLARTEADSFRWRGQFIRTVLERDLPLLGVKIPAATLYRFWMMLAHYQGNTWNAAEPARSLGLSQPTVRHYLDLMTDLLMVRQLAPWHENLLKRQVKSPKVYVRDTGLLHQLLGIRTEKELLGHPKMGSSWEGYAIEEVLKLTGPDGTYFWATHTGAELDLLILKDGKRYGFEIKRQDAPRVTASMRIALEDLRLDNLCVLYAGSRVYEPSRRVRMVPLVSLAQGSVDILLRKA
jgi:predicted AAA+ superfamily ATPase